MSISYFNPHHELKRFDMWVCRPSGTALRKIKHCYNENLKVKFGAINELMFTIPAKIEDDHQPVKNELVALIRERYIIRLKRNDEIQNFIVMKIDKNQGNDGFEEVTYTCFGVGIQLGAHIVKDREYVAETMRFIIRDLLSETVWNIGYMDEKFNLHTRNFEWGTSSILQCIFEVAEKWNAIVVFDTVKLELSFYQSESLSRNKGIRLKKGKYLESLSLNIDPQSIATRVVAYGEDGMEFRSLSPTGSNYLEDFSFFMYPFECDANYNVIRPSNWMSNELCINITKYQKLLESLQGRFKSLSDRRTKLRDDMQQIIQEKTKITDQIKVQDHTIDVSNATWQENSYQHQIYLDAVAKKNQLIPQRDQKDREIDALQIQIDAVDLEIEQFRDIVSMERNFTAKDLHDLNKDFIIIKEHYNDSIYDEQDLLDETYDVFDEIRQPPLNTTISVEDFVNNFNESFYKGLDIGDILYLKSENLEINIKVVVTELSFSLNQVQITVANTTRVDDEWKDFAKKLSISYNTSTTVNYEKNKWKDGREAKDMVTDMLDDAFEGAKWLITGGANDTTKLNERGLISIDQFDKNAWLMIQSGQMFITPDGGNSVVVAISKNGVHAERLVGRIILGNKLHIEDTDGIVTIQNALITVYDQSRKPRVHLGRYPDPNDPRNFKYGLRIYDGAIDIRTSDGIGGIQFDKQGLRAYNNNGVKTFEVNAVTGEVNIAGSLTIKTHPDSYRGVVIDGNGIRGYNRSGGIVFEIDNNGNAWFAGRLEWATGTVDNLKGTFGGTLNFVDGTFTGTLRGVNGEFTGTLKGVDGDFSGVLRGATGEFAGLVVGDLSFQTMKGISIDAKQITSGKITADMMDVRELSAITANLGTVFSGELNGVYINTEKDLFVGNEIHLGTHYSDQESKLIKFGGVTGGSIQHRGDMLILSALWGVLVNDLTIMGTLDIRQATVLK